VLVYKFKKEKLENGIYVTRPRILVELNGPKGTINVPALIDTGCDRTVIPEGISRAIGLKMNGEKDKIYAFREYNDVIQSHTDITFLGKQHRQSVTLPSIPILIALADKSINEGEDIILGIEGIFDVFDITFKKANNKIIIKEIGRNIFSLIR